VSLVVSLSFTEFLQIFKVLYIIFLYCAEVSSYTQARSGPLLIGRISDFACVYAGFSEAV